MKKTGILVLVVAFISMSFANPTNPLSEKLKVDVSDSTVTWKGYKPTGSHEGTIELVTGDLEVKGKKIKSGNFTINMSTLKDSERNKRLENHLKSKDFFEIEVYPTAYFEITSSKNKGGKTFVTGQLTIKNITREITFPATLTRNGSTVTLTSETFQINRADFNVKYKSKTFFNNLKEKFISDEFDLQVTIVAQK